MTDTRGTLTNNETGLVITGVMTGEYLDNFDFRIDGTSESNILMTGDWTFTPETPPLPTEPGLYGIYRFKDGTTIPDPAGFRTFVLTSEGTWREQGDNDMEPADLERFILGQGWELRRLVWEETN